MNKEIRDFNSEDAKSSKNFGDMKNSAGTAAKALYAESDNIKDITSKVLSDLGDFLKDRKCDIVDAKSKARNHIKENPFLVVAGAIVAGALLGFIFKK